MFERKNEILITGEITTEAANEIQREIDALVENGAEKICFRITSKGGSVVAGLQIYDSITALTNIETECLIVGICGSAATYAAMACDKVRMQPNATLFLHLCEGGLYGTIEEIQNDLVFFENLQNQVLAIYAVKTGRTTDEIFEEIHSPKYYTAEQALSKNWVDEISGTELKIDFAFSNTMTEKTEVESENETPIFSLKNIVKKCRDLIKGTTDEERTQLQKLTEYENKIEELENRLKVEHTEKVANVEELKNRIAELEFEKANLNNTIENEVTKRIASLGYATEELPQPTNEISKLDFKKIVKEQGLNAALNSLLGN